MGEELKQVRECEVELKELGWVTPDLDVRLWACIIKLITAVIFGFHNKLECLSINARLGWKGLPGTNTLTYCGYRKLQP